MPNLTDYDPDCAEASAELWSQLANHEGEDADAQLIIARAFKEYACEADKRITSDQWAQKYKDACIHISKLTDALERTIPAITAGYGKAQRDHIIAQARAALNGE